MTRVGLRTSSLERCHHCPHGTPPAQCWWCITTSFWRLCDSCFLRATGKRPTP